MSQDKTFIEKKTTMQGITWYQMNVTEIPTTIHKRKLKLRQEKSSIISIYKWGAWAKNCKMENPNFLIY